MKTIILNASLLVIFEVLTRGISFGLIMVYTRFLDADAMGLYATFLSFSTMMTIFVGLSAHGAIEANFHKLSKDGLAQYIGNVIFSLFGLVVIVCLCISILGKHIHETFDISLSWQILCVVLVFFQSIALLKSSIWIMRGEPIRYGLFQLLFVSISSIVGSTLILFMGFGWQGQAYGLFVSAALSGIFSIYLLRKDGLLRFTPRKAYLTDLFGYGLPMIPHQVGNWMKGQGDRLVLISMMGSAVAGEYFVAFQVGSIMGIILLAGNRAYFPFLFKLLSKDPSDNEKIKIVRMTYGLGMAIFLAVLVFDSILVNLYPYLVGEKFQDGLFISRVIVWAFLWDGFYYLFSGYIFFKKQTDYLAKLTLIITFFHLVMIYFLVQKYDENGVAYALFITFFIQALGVFWLGNKLVPMPWFRALSLSPAGISRSKG